ncbi:DUF423 domain-containing protein [Arhodomonas aquaeolei]|uniref:DUF423 domain-containing protein n=1 Tax=Arhodomonas aquaeolei TaxID=2369 RepID=UPI0021677C8B|nr:DUF423 domain-containing protein [Arhodomonas aquaeolei]MCS4504517.1 DUF423 domain-containing protein [Arhodomonas aquaeolei]
MSGRLPLAAGAVAGLLGVALGAFGSHALRDVLSAERMAVWETAVHYQFVHALALVAVAAPPGAVGRCRRGAVGCFVTGLVLFPGSLYLLCLTGVGAFGVVTPFGGMVWLVGWALLIADAVSRRG